MCCAGEGPQAGEVFSVVRVGETKLAIKSAYGRYVSVATSGELAGRSEAVGPREQWELVFEEVCVHVLIDLQAVLTLHCWNKACSVLVV